MTDPDTRDGVAATAASKPANEKVAISSAAKMITLLLAIAGSHHKFTLSDLVDRTGLSGTSTHRLLQEMLQAGLVERASGRKYKLGRELYHVASQIVAKFDLNRSARPFIEDLGRQWQETAVVCGYSPRGLHGAILDVVHSPHPLRFAVERGGRVALLWGSLGRSMLAFLPSGEIEAVLRRNEVSSLHKSPRPPRGELLQELETIRKNGFSRNYDPEIGIAGIASPVFGLGGQVVGCIGVTMPSSRFKLEASAELAASVRKAARQLTETATNADF